MTHPSLIAFGPDSGPNEEWKPKIYLQTLLYSTAKRGRVIESMYVALHRNESRQNFNIWIHVNDRVSRGSGLFVGETGVLANHHFRTPFDENGFKFHEGTYKIEVFAKLVDEKQSRSLFSHALVVTNEQSSALRDSQSYLYFNWGSDTGKYLSHVETECSKEHE